MLEGDVYNFMIGQALLAEFVGMTLFLFVTIGTMVNGCKTVDVGVPFSDPSTLGFSVSGTIGKPSLPELHLP